MTKKILCALLVAAMTLSMAACGGKTTTGGSSSTGGSTSGSASTGSTDSGETPAIDMEGEPYEAHFMYLVAAEGSNQDKIQAAMNELTLKEINMTVDLIPQTFGAYYTTIATSLASNEPLDMAPVFAASFASYIESGYLVNLYDYDEYLTGVKEYMGDAYYAGDVGGFLVGFTEMKEWGFPVGVIARKDIMDQLGYTVEDFNIDGMNADSYMQLDELFQRVKDETGLLPVGGTGIMGTQAYSWYDSLGNNFGVLANYGQDKTVTNWYESDTFKMLCDTAKRWFDAGYVSADAATNQDSGETFLKAGNTFSFITYYKPNTTVEKKAQTTYDTVVIPITPNGIKSNASISSLVYSLCNAAEDKVKAAQFMNFAYTNGDFNDLINWGLEGEDWIEDENGQAAYPDGIDATNVATHNDFGWGLPNQFSAHAWAGNPIDIWDQYREYNDAMLKSAAYGFSFDATVVSDQVAQCNNVESEFLKSLVWGAVSDVDASIAEFNDKLYAAGLQDIIDAKQGQLDEWFAANN